MPATASESGKVTILRVETWAVFFDFCSALLKEGLRDVKSLAEIFRGEPDSSKAGGSPSDALNIWTYDIESKSFTRLTENGGYLSPRMSVDRQRIACIHHGKLRVMDADFVHLQVFDLKPFFRKILAWHSPDDEFLLLDTEDKTYRFAAKSGKLEEVVLLLDDSQSLELDTLIGLSQTAANGERVYVRTDDGSHRVLADRHDYYEPRLLLESDHIIRHPSWIEADSELIFVSDR